MYLGLWKPDFSVFRLPDFRTFRLSDLLFFIRIVFNGYRIFGWFDMNPMP